MRVRVAFKIQAKSLHFAESWCTHTAGKIELCNVPIPVREQKVDM